MLITDAVHVWRESDGDYHIEWEASHPDTEVTVEPLTESDVLVAHYTEEPVKRARLSGLAPDSRHFFRLSDQHGTEVVVSERRFGMQGTPNFRDFGGYRTADGRQVKWGYLFRSGQLNNLSEQDLALLGHLNLDLICDFRRMEEQEGEPSRLPERRPKVASLPIIPGSNARFFEEAEGRRTAGRETMHEFMLEVNRQFAEDQTEVYARMFREILALEDARFLVHCAAGKDRTGFAAALVLLALGVPRELVMQDYMLTARYFRPERELERLRRKYQMEDMDVEAIMPILEVHEDYLSRALESIGQHYQSVEAYLEEALGVGPAELAELRSRYLE
jgi:protein-tyrosine phosphatase